MHTPHNHTIVHTIPATHEAIITTVRNGNLVSNPGIASHAFGHVLHPGVDFLHRILALMTAFVIVFGAYSLIDAEFGVFAFDALAYSFVAGAGTVGALFGVESRCDPKSAGAGALTALRNAFFSLQNMGGPTSMAARSLVGGCPH